MSFHLMTVLMDYSLPTAGSREGFRPHVTVLRKKKMSSTHTSLEFTLIV